MRTPYRVLLTNSTDIYGGGEFYVLELAKALQSRHHDVLVVCKPGNLLAAKCLAAGVPVHTVDFPAQGRLVRSILKLREVIRKQRSQIVHTNSNYDRTAGAFAARLTGAVHITNVHSFHSLRYNLTHRVRNAQATDHYIVDGVCVKDLLVRKDGIKEKDISVVYLGVDPDSMRRDETLRAAIRREFGMKETEIVIGNVARFVPFKGHEYLLRSFAEVQKENPGTRFLLVGDGELHEPLVGLARKLGLDKRVVFAGFRDDLPAVYSAMDIYAHSSVEGGGETFPFAVLQALSQELPVVATRVGDVAEMVREGLSGFLVPDRDPSQLAQKLSLLCRDGALRTKMATQGRNLLLSRFTTNSMVDAVENLYSSVLRENG
jgi:glycosyltransferase involved in cell wall biosynthesis